MEGNLTAQEQVHVVIAELTKEYKQANAWPEGMEFVPEMVEFIVDYSNGHNILDHKGLLDEVITTYNSIIKDEPIEQNDPDLVTFLVDLIDRHHGNNRDLYAQMNDFYVGVAHEYLLLITEDE